MNQKSFIGVDAGGTKIDVLIEWQEDRYSAKHRGTNARAESEKVLGLQISDAIREVAPPGLDLSHSSICIGAAGAGTKSVQNALWQCVSAYLDIPDSSVHVVSDARIAHAAAFGVASTSGTLRILVITGTGSGCYTVSSAGDLIRSGGWGAVLGDPASGTSIGIAGIKHLLALIESGESSSFGDAILAAINAESTSEVLPCIPDVLDAVYAKSFRPSQTAVAVLRFAEKDESAENILTDQCNMLADQCARLRSATHEQSIEISLTGGLTGHVGFLNLISRVLKERLPDAVIGRSSETPVFGALALARKNFNTA